MATLQASLLLALLASTSSFGSARTLLPGIPDARIVNGTEAGEAEYPSQLSLKYFGSHMCGATIISADWALTAAHCVVDLSASQLSLRAGSNNINGGSSHPVAQLVSHDGYDSSKSWINDIAVLKVSKPFPLNGQNVQAARLPAQGQATPPGTSGTVVGWGYLSNIGPLPSRLQKVAVSVTEPDVCNDAYKPNYPVYVSQICAGVPGGLQGFCSGDSGGPLFVGGEIVGVVSWTMLCAIPGYPDVYTRVSSYRDWISDKSGV